MSDMEHKAPRNYTSENIAGKRAIVTGGTTGIGRATAKLLLERGARVLIFGRDENDLQSALDELAACGEVHGLSADQAKIEDVQRVFKEADDKLGGLDILVNNAAISSEGLQETDLQQVHYVLDVNVFGVMACTKEAMTRFASQHSGHVVVIGSMSAETRSEDDEIYGPSKAAVRAFCASLRKTVNPQGVKVTLIEPGLVNTPILDSSPAETAEDKKKKAILEAEDIAECVHYALTQPARCNVVEVQIRPIGQPI